MTLKSTKTVITDEFKKLTPKQLESVIKKMEDLKTSMQKSDYAFSDASLLFLPTERVVEGGTVRSNTIRDLEIRFIDMSRAMSKSELEDRLNKASTPKDIAKARKALQNFEKMQLDMKQSMEDMIAMCTDILEEKKSSSQRK